MTRADSRLGLSPAPARRRSAALCPNAFSLVELLFVIAIIAIVAAMAMPRYGRSVARYRAECAAKRVAADLALARSTAKAVSETRVVTFNTVAGSYTLAGVKNLDHHKAQPYTVALSDAPYNAQLYYADFGGAPQAEFDMYGAAKWGGKVIVRVGEFEQTVALSRDDGSVTVQ
jgi:prepilin-type N-terminal cleavage/methylation domain-containing protein